MKRLLLVIVLGAICGIGALMLFVFSGDDDAPPATVDTSRPAPGFLEIKDNYETMTEAQWENFADETKGAYVDGWSGTVQEVDQTLGKYNVTIEYDTYPELRFYIPDYPKEDALALERDQEVSVSGTVSLVSAAFGYSIHLENATITTK